MPGGWGIDLLDELGRLRYDMPTSAKETFARQVMSPMISDVSESQAPSDRAAAGYLFRKAHPWLQRKLQPWIDAARIGWAGDTPEEQSFATYGANIAGLRR